MKDPIDKFFGYYLVISAVVSVLVGVGLVYLAAHFIAKFW